MFTSTPCHVGIYNQPVLMFTPCGYAIFPTFTCTYFGSKMTTNTNNIPRGHSQGFKSTHYDAELVTVSLNRYAHELQYRTSRRVNCNIGHLGVDCMQVTAAAL